jgi:YidC/Oxa1 family membrane protein insertase
MDNIRLILIVAWCGLLFMIYSAWVEDYGPVTPALQQQFDQNTAPPVSPSVTTAPTASDVPSAAPLASTPVMSSGQDVQQQQGTETPITVETDVFQLEISPRGGTITNLWLRQYARQADDPETRFQLLKAMAPNMFIVQSGLLGADQDSLPSHEALFSTTQRQYQMRDNDNVLIVELTWRNATGLEVSKQYRFERGQYVIEVSQTVRNVTDHSVALRQYNQLQRTPLHDPNQSRFVSTYTGAVYYGPEEKYKKQSFDTITETPLTQEVTGGWVAMMQHYFMAAWIPPQSDPQTFFTKALPSIGGETRYIIGTYSPSQVLAPGTTYTFRDQLFIGPKLQDVLVQVAPGLHLAVDYGWLTIIAEPIFWLLNHIHSLVGNWGWAIILLTILIKLAFYKLSEASYRSMAQLRRFTPRMKALKDRYGDDKARLNQAMMELYKKEKINPLGGCLPILVQIPVFIALYWVLLESVELRHAPFILWLDNLTAADPYYVLPLLMGASMFVQQKLNPAPPDPMQEKIMMALPVVFTVFFAFFPSGLVLYWTVNNLLSISQQWYITRKIENAGHHSTK